MALIQNDPHRAPAQATGPADHAVVGGMSRRTQILRLLLRYRGSGVFAGMHLDPAAINEYEVPAEGTPDQFVSDLESLGPTFVKLGQMLSTRPDIVPPEFATALERMQENTSSVPVEHIRQIIEEELGVSVNKAFSHFDPVPLGCASLAQVHRAALRDGTPVAIKVQKPEVAAQVRSDMEVLKSFATAADRLTGIGRRVRFADWLGEFGKTLRAELNYQDEAETLVRFGKHLKPFPQLWVPQPIWDLSSRRVLTMQLAEGVRVDKISGCAAPNSRWMAWLPNWSRGIWTRCSCMAKSTPTRTQATCACCRTGAWPFSTWAWWRTCRRACASAYSNYCSPPSMAAAKKWPKRPSRSARGWRITTKNATSARPGR